MADVADEVEALAAMVDNGHISETHLREILDQADDPTDTEDDEAYVEAKLEEQRQLNAELKRMEMQMEAEEAAAARGRSPPRRKTNKPIVSKRVVEGVARVKQGDGGSHSPTESRRIQRANMNLLNKLNGIQRNGGITNSWQAQPICKHKTTSAVNRLSSQRKIEGQNMQLLKKLQSVKSTMSKGTRAPLASSRRPVHQQPRKSKSKKRPEWVDVSGVGLM